MGPYLLTSISEAKSITSTRTQVSVLDYATWSAVCSVVGKFPLLDSIGRSTPFRECRSSWSCTRIRHGPHICFGDLLSQIRSHFMAPPTPEWSALFVPTSLYRFPMISEGALDAGIDHCLLQAQRTHVSYYCPPCSAEKVAA